MCFCHPRPLHFITPLSTHVMLNFASVPMCVHHPLPLIFITPISTHVILNFADRHAYVFSSSVSPSSRTPQYTHAISANVHVCFRRRRLLHHTTLYTCDLCDMQICFHHHVVFITHRTSHIRCTHVILNFVDMHMRLHHHIPHFNRTTQYLKIMMVMKIDGF